MVDSWGSRKCLEMMPLRDRTSGSLVSLPELGVLIVLLSPGRERKRISPGEVVFGPGAAPSWGCSVSLRQGRTLQRGKFQAPSLVGLVCK